MDRKLEIRRMPAADLPEVLKIMREVYEQLEIKAWFSMDEEDHLADYMTNSGFCLEMLVDGALAGIFIARCQLPEEDNLGTYLQLEESEMSEVAHMEIAMVKKEYRGLGIQKRLMQEAEELLKLKNYHYLMGTAHPDNIYSVENFRKLGYTCVTKTLKYGGLPRYIFCKKI